MNILNFLPGKKTYVLSLAMILSIIATFLQSQFDNDVMTTMSVGQLIDQLYVPLAVIFVRKGISGD